ncbi:efflux RND transporter permease subunit [Shewanella surugensis]|uniref:Efflux RND transporter permease subunit n=1 Tax=Shewanella surugensis TaxID=212020 RepID=A0ABT0LFJ9_9GAMM|nr:efflux RND transporter permease subunit [Shewanella surugensis]MCL1126487.1 efflux RND transporter permease subunit [Shewanella surugensis]
MSIIRTAVQRPISVWMFMLAIILFGMVGFSRLAVKLLPDLSYPSVTIRTLYNGAAPVEVEQLVSKPIEEAVGIVKGLRQISSISRSGLSDVVLEFEWGTDMNMASLAIREKLEAIDLPLDINKPLLLRFNPNLDPIMRLALSTPNANDRQLKQIRTYASEELKRELESIKGIASVKLSGGLEQEVHIQLDQHKLSQLHLNANDIKNRIEQENINLSAGKVLQGDKEYLVRTLNQFNSLEELGQIIIYRNDMNLIKLFEVADIIDAHKERSDMTRIAGQESVELAIYKEGDANTVASAQRIKDQLTRLKKIYPDASLDVIYDQSEFISQAIDEVINTALIGSLLSMLVIYLFLKDIIPTLIISLAIPFSVIATFNMMYFADISLNMMSLGGIALAVGLLVDNAIVVLENINRCQSQGMDKIHAAITGTKQVAGAIVASTLTTLAVFIPLIFVDGVAGALFSDQALTVTFALIASLIVALTTIPMLASRKGIRFLPQQDNHPPLAPDSQGKPSAKNWQSITRQWLTFPFKVLFHHLPFAITTALLTLSRLFAWLGKIILSPLRTVFDTLYHYTDKYYSRALKGALNNKSISLGIALSISLGAASLLPKLGMELIPTMQQSSFYADVLLPPGTEVHQTDNVLQQLAASIESLSDVKQVYSQAGSSGLMTSNVEQGGENWGRLHVKLSNKQGLERVSQHLRQAATMIPSLELNIQQPSLFSVNTPLEIELSGYDIKQLTQVSQQLVDKLSQDNRFQDVQTSLKSGQPELSIRFDHARLAALNMDAPTVAKRIAQRIGGTFASQYTIQDRKVDILVRSHLKERDQLSDIDSMIINPDNIHPITLSSVADVSLALGPSAINRLHQQRIALISANIAYGDLNQAVSQAQAIVSQQSLPNSLQLRFGGQNEEMQASFTSLKMALLLAIVLVYLVMASQFESLLHPLFILITIPMALAGSILGLYLTHTPLSVVVFIGLIMLAGIVVNNAIVLVDRINQLRSEGMDKPLAIITAAQSRLRPILMTTLTTTLGLFPMALGLGDGSEIRAPMAISVIFGLSLSTLLTLIVLPVIYSLFDRKEFAEFNQEASHSSFKQQDNSNNEGRI